VCVCGVYMCMVCMCVCDVCRCVYGICGVGVRASRKPNYNTYPP